MYVYVLAPFSAAMTCKQYLTFAVKKSFRSTRRLRIQESAVQLDLQPSISLLIASFDLSSLSPIVQLYRLRNL